MNTSELEDGIVVGKDLAKKLINQFLYKIGSWRDQEELEKGDIFLSDCNGGWNLVDPENPDMVMGMFGYNGIIICTLDLYMKDFLESKTLDEWGADCVNEDGIVIWPWDNERGYEIFVFHEGD